MTYQVRNGWVFVWAYLTPTTTIPANAIHTLFNMPEALRAEDGSTGGGNVYFAASDINSGSHGSPNAYMNANGDVNILQTIQQGTGSRFAFNGIYPI